MQAALISFIICISVYFHRTRGWGWEMDDVQADDQERGKKQSA